MRLSANNNVENKLRELGVELNTDATKLNNLSRLLSALLARSSPPPSLRKGRDDDTFKVDCYEKDEKEKKKQSVHQKGKWNAFSRWRNSSQEGGARRRGTGETRFGVQKEEAKRREHREQRGRTLKGNIARGC